MAKFIGRRVAVGIGLEASRGVGVAPSYVLGKTNYTLDDKANKATSGEGIGSISANGCISVVTNRYAEGDIEFEIGAKSFPIIMSSALGGAISSASEGTGYKHSVAVAENNQHPTLSVTLDDPNGDVIFEGAMADSLEISVTPDSIIGATLSMKAKASSDTSYSASPECEYKFVGRDLEFKVADDTSGLSASTKIALKEMSLTISKNADYDFVLSTIDPEDILNHQMMIEGSVTLNYEDRTWRDYMLNGSYKAVGIKLEQSRASAGDQNPTIYIELPKVHFSDWESTRGNEDIVGQTIKFSALYDMESEKIVSNAYVINDVASY